MTKPVLACLRGGTPTEPFYLVLSTQDKKSVCFFTDGEFRHVLHVDDFGDIPASEELFREHETKLPVYAPSLIESGRCERITKNLFAFLEQKVPKNVETFLSRQEKAKKPVFKKVETQHDQAKARPIVRKSFAQVTSSMSDD